MSQINSRYFRPEDNDDGELTPVHSSGTYPVYRSAAEEMCKKLLLIKDPVAIMMAEDLNWFADIFSKWSPINKPDDKTRERLIGEFMELFNKIYIYLDL